MKRMSKRKKTDFDLKEEEHLKTFLKIVPDEEGIVNYKVLEKRFLITNWESKFYHYDKHGAEGIYYRIFRSDGSSRWIKTFSEMVTRFDRLDLMELYNLVMQRVHTLTLEDGTEIHMLAERKYPLTKETLKNMMSLKLVAEHQELASPEQTAFGKDFSNLLMANSLPKTIWFSAHHASQQDAMELYRLVKERFQTASPEGYDFLLWGDLKTMIVPNEEDEIWRNQQDWNLINWKKRISMLSRRLEVDHQSEMGYELIRLVLPEEKICTASTELNTARRLSTAA
ncbi:hypothetical protein Tco_0172559 [Tanacetum coccineum]